MLVVGEVLTKLCTLPGFVFELQFEKFFNRLWAFINSVIPQIYIEYVVQTCLVDSQGSD